MLAASARFRAYFAAPLFSEMEREYNVSVVARLEKYIDVFLPQRDGGLLMQYVKEGVGPDRAGRLIFEKDLMAMQSADALIAVLDGSTIDEGVAFEIGYMFALGKICVALQTDVRRALPTGNNPMIGSSISSVFQNIADLVDWARHAHLEPSLRDGTDVGLGDQFNVSN
jgi:nucleoside 2-deoxyribosyltransferase